MKSIKELHIEKINYHATRPVAEISGGVLTFLYKGFNNRGLGLNINLSEGVKWSCQYGEGTQQNGAYCQQKGLSHK
ncbi:hypothetical protein FEF09_11000 [Chitinophaga pinensis]|uniref:Uncharacterized protein n=1 Tax=Chitinophaga pinensis TaxID=79329 RepID=A0A5C6LYU9_9BACT|nr:hypothetical protein FEF09_11000 [Chitinophaga pinensis]